MKISEMSDDEASSALLKAYRGACDSYDPDAHGLPHPSRDVNRWIKISATGGAPGQDDVQPSESEPGQAGPEPAKDGRYVVAADGVPTWMYADGRTVHGNDAILARSRALAPNRSRVRGMSAAIKDYGRLR